MSFDRAALARVTGAGVAAVEAAAELLEQESNALVPDLSGEMQASSKVSVDRGEPASAVSYDTPYAARQHEDLGARHDDGQAKFLEQALHSNSRELLAVMAGELRRVLH